MPESERMTIAQMNAGLVTGVREGRWIAYMHDGQIRFKHPDHATTDELLNRLTPEQTSAMLRLED